MKSETVTKIQSAIIGNAGEHLAISYLLRKNLIAGLAPQNTEDFDVVVMSRTGQTLFPVQVKASTKKNWMLSKKHERPIKNLIYIFIRFSKDLMNSEMYILDSEKVAQVTKTSHAIWLKLPSSNGAPHKSTKIRNLIAEGKIELANLMLGRPYEISGIVTRGKKIARDLGFPTANFFPKDLLIKPKFGVYKVLVNGKYKGVMNFGTKPTLGSSPPLFEVHIFNFNQDLYNKKITVELLEFIREEKKFSGIEELKNQIKKDCEIANV